jgi:hypothetical protein
LITRRNSTTARRGIWEGARRSQFDELESPALKKLPVEPYLYAEWKE